MAVCNRGEMKKGNPCGFPLKFGNVKTVSGYRVNANLLPVFILAFKFNHPVDHGK